jgi:CBS domain containing-hemolysin-like protein
MNEVVFENVKFTVLEVEDRRIEKIKVEITPIVDDDKGEEEDD